LDPADHETDHVGKGGAKVSFLDATYKGDLGIVQSLLDQGADINMRNEALETLLDQAAWTGEVRVVRFLLARGAEVDPRDKFERTPLHSAAQVWTPRNLAGTHRPRRKHRIT